MSEKRWGDSVVYQVMRDGKELTLHGVPPAQRRPKQPARRRRGDAARRCREPLARRRVERCAAAQRACASDDCAAARAGGAVRRARAPPPPPSPRAATRCASTLDAGARLARRSTDTITLPAAAVTDGEAQFLLNGALR